MRFASSLLFSALLLGGVVLAQDPKTPPKKDTAGEKTKAPEEKPAKKTEPKPEKKKPVPKQPKKAQPADQLNGVKYLPLHAGRRWTYTVTFTIQPLVAEGKEKPKPSEAGKHRVDVYVANPQRIGNRKAAALEWKLDSNLAQRSYYVLKDGYLQCVRRLQGAGQHVKKWSFSPAQKVVPVAPKVGQKWDWEGKNGSDTGKQSYEVLRAEKLVVPAGTFDTLVIKTTYTGEDESKGVQTRWLAPGVGIVKEVNEVRNARRLFRTEGVLRRYLAP